MTSETSSNICEEKRSRKVYRNGASDAVYGLGFIGALVFYLGHATSFWIGVLGILKSIVWPAMLVFEMLKFLNMQ
jgi:hypothetical protein